MTARVLLALALPPALGMLLVACVWPGRRPADHAGLKAALGAGLGVGVSSCLFFLWLVLFNGRIGALFGVEVTLAVLCAGALYWRRRRAAEAEWPAPDALPTATRRLLTAGILALTAWRVAPCLIAAAEQPHGQWDAWAIWNLRARFLFRGVTHWTDAFSEHLYRFHPDYPLMLPGAVAHGWFAAGAETPLVPILLGILFAFATVLLLYFGLAAARNEWRGGLAALTLLTTPLFLFHASSQYADVPLGFFFLATTALLCLHDRMPAGHSPLLVLAGISAGLAAWTKNEGLFFLGAVAVAGLLVRCRRGRTAALLRDGQAFLLGLLPVLTVVAIFKLGYAPANDLVAASQSAGVGARLGACSRHVQIGQDFLRRALEFGHWTRLSPIPFNPVPLLLGWLVLTGTRVETRDRPGAATAALALGLTLAGYFGAFLVTPADLRWHLETAGDRLFLQLWPSALFLCFLVLPSPGCLWSGTRRPSGG